MVEDKKQSMEKKSYGITEGQINVYKTQLELMLREGYEKDNQYYYFELRGSSLVDNITPFLEEGTLPWLRKQFESFELIDYVYIVTAFDLVEKGVYEVTVRGLISVRSIFGKSYDLTLSILRLLCNAYYQTAYKEVPRRIYKFEDLKESLYAMVKEYKFENHLLYWFTSSDPFVLVRFKEKELHYSNRYVNMDEFFSLFPYPLHLIECKPANKTLERVGRNLEEVDIDIETERMLIIIWRLYMTVNDMVVHRGVLYKKIDRTKHSYERVGDIENLKDIYSIYEDLIGYFRHQMQDININKLIQNGLEGAWSRVKRNEKILPMAELDVGIIEFRDGLYFIRSKKFKEFKELGIIYEGARNSLRFCSARGDTGIKLIKNYSTLLYCSKKYNSAKKPKYFLTELEKEEQGKEFLGILSKLYKTKLKSTEIPGYILKKILEELREELYTHLIKLKSSYVCILIRNVFHILGEEALSKLFIEKLEFSSIVDVIKETKRSEKELPELVIYLNKVGKI